MSAGLEPRPGRVSAVPGRTARNGPRIPSLVRLGVGVASRVFDTLAPGSCVTCGRGVEPSRPPICSLCLGRLPRLSHPRCGRCGMPGDRPVGDPPAEATSAAPCDACLPWPPELAAGAAPFAFEGHAERLVHALKYGRWRRLAEPMGRAMSDAARDLAGRSGASLLVPVPLSRARARERGFNQAEALADVVAAELGLPQRSVIERRSGGRRQARLARAGRRENVRRLFLAREPGRGRSVLLVDDVVTTGATAGACAEALAEAGFGRVAVVSFARTLRRLEDTA